MTRPPPAALSISLLLAIAGGVTAWALSGEPAGARAARPRMSLKETLTRDVLTGRLLRPDGTPEPPAEGWGSADQPIRLRFIPSGDQAIGNPTVDRLVEFLRRRTGYAIESAMLRSYGLVVQEIVEGGCDIAFLTAASYARAYYATKNNSNPDDDIVAFLAAVRQGHPDYPGGDLAYRGAIIVRSDSDLTDLSQLDESRTVAMGNRTSGTGSVLPSALLDGAGLNPRIVRFESPPVVVYAVLEGAADAGCIWWSPPTEDNPENDARILVKSTHPDVFARTRILAFTPWIPNEPVVARAAVPEAIRHTLSRALCLFVSTLAVTDEGRRELESIGTLVGFVPATNEDFAPLFEVIDRAFANDPEGRADFMAGSR
jgi:phosphonate transport system substrate-binding protein